MEENEGAYEKCMYPSLHDPAMESVVWSEELCRKIESGFREMDGRECTDLPKSIDSRSILPLYKYRSFDPAHPERTETTIVDGRLWSPSIEALNDPLEAAIVLGKDSDQREMPGLTMYYNSQWCGCICFSYDPVCAQMWAHYACNHEGYVLKYERLSNYLLRSRFCRPVKYRRHPSDVDILNRPESVRDALWTKSEVWEYEREVRLQYPRTNSYTAAGLLKPSGVVFGLRTPSKHKDIITEFASNLKTGQIVSTGHPYSLKVEWYEGKRPNR
ncbi:MAG: DUF2971 domain-containing protein [bacterium]|nr:DUF2971 domain-containing protein [bacterium]